MGNFNPPAPCGAGPGSSTSSGMFSNFNPPAPCGAGPSQFCFFPAHSRFQSTRPLRGGTQSPWRFLKNFSYFNPPAPCGAGPQQNISILLRSQFQSTRPLRGGTTRRLCGRRRRRFQSTRPLRGGTWSSRPITDGTTFQSTRPLRGGTAILHKKTVQNIAYCTKSAFTLAVLSGFLALMRPFFCQTCTNFGANLPKNRCSLPVRTLIPSGPPPADSRH